MRLVLAAAIAVRGASARARGGGSFLLASIAVRGASALARGGKSAARMPRGVKKENLPTKVCVVCDRPFTWRKKWERCWDEVTTCSKTCNAARRRGKGGGGDALGGGENAFGAVVSDDDDVSPRSPATTDEDPAKAARKLAKKAAKADRRAKRAGVAATTTGQKDCDLCGASVDLLVRCRVDATREWKMACGKCWKDVSGGVVDGDAAHPHYQYGGLWKNRNVQSGEGLLVQSGEGLLVA